MVNNSCLLLLLAVVDHVVTISCLVYIYSLCFVAGGVVVDLVPVVTIPYLLHALCNPHCEVTAETEYLLAGLPVLLLIILGDNSL